MAGKLALSVSQLNEYVRRLLQQDPLLREIELKGEISNLKFHQTGTVFFTLKDADASVSCVMYASDAEDMQVEPFEGMRAMVSGSVGLYARGGQYQFYAKAIRAQGLGVLYERYQMLKEKLEREGLFNPQKKRTLPGYVDTIGVVSSPTGAVIHDILHVALRRDEQARILLCPVRVQGPEAAGEVVHAIELLNRMEGIDVIILARGGGSIEDLWTFNEERVVRSVRASRIPIVSAIGHETDYTLCDFAADFRAPTPSAAAECVVPVRSELMDALRCLKREIKRTACGAMETAQAAIMLNKAALTAAHPKRQVEREQLRLAAMKERLRQCALGRIEREEAAVSARRMELRLLSPYEILSRGYALVTRNGEHIGSAADVQVDEQLEVRMFDGVISTRVCAKATDCQKEGD